MRADQASQKKVLHILNGFGPGGVETWLLSAVKYLHTHPEINLQFDFLISGGVPRIYDEEIKKYGSKIFYARYSIGTIPSFRKSIRRILRNNNYTAIHDHEDFIAGWHFLLTGKLSPRTKIAHLHNPYNFVHNYVVNPVRRFSFNMGRRLMANEATAITGTSNAVMDEYGYDKPPFINKRVGPAYCGFDTCKFIYDAMAKASLCSELGWNTDSKIGLFIGRIGLQSYDTAANQKNPAFAFEVAKQLVTKHPEWRFLFVGFKGDTGNQMEKEISESTLSEKIKFIDIRHDVPKIMSAADVLVFPSLWEGLGMVCVEAQCTGLTVIISDTVPTEAIVCPELVAVKSLDEGVNEWVNIIHTSLQTSVGRSIYAERIRQSPFSIENSVKRLQSLYES
jgi:glycosyltransferase EpsF